MVSVSETLAFTGESLNLPECIPISELLANMDFSGIELTLHEHLNYAQGRRWKYPPILLLKLLVVKLFRNLSYTRAVNSLSHEDCTFLDLQKTETGDFSIPSASTLHDFAYNRLGITGVEEIMKKVGTIACKHIRNASGMIDSTPVEAARYDKYAQFNPHYQCKMYKMHIFHLDQFPLFEIFTEGKAHDSPYTVPLCETVRLMNPDLKTIKLDAAYDSFLNYAEIWKLFRVFPLIDWRENAVVHNEGSLEKIDYWVNKKWKEGGYIHAPIEKKLDFLYDMNRKEQVGMYIRNQNIQNPSFKLQYKSRSDCERTHSHMKRMFTFTVRWIQDRSKEFYMGLNFIAYQMVLLARIQQNEPDIQDLSQYI